MSGPSEGEKALEQYVAELDRFSDNAVVAEDLIRVQRNLLFRSRAFSNDDITRLLERVRKMAKLHSQDALEVQLNARESALAALQAIASERKIAAVDRYCELRAMIGNGESPDPRAEKELISGFRMLAYTFQAKYPATLFSIWGDLVAVLPQPPIRAQELALLACTQIIPQLAKADPLAAFVIWAQVMQWGRAVEDGSKMAAALIIGANSILLPDPDQPREINEVIWEFIKTADSGRGSNDEGVNGRMMSVIAAVDMALYLTVLRIEARQDLLDRLRQGGAVQWESDDGMAISAEVIVKNNELAGAVEAYDQPVAETLAYAEQWLHPDLVTHQNWLRFIKRLQQLRSKEMGLSPSLGRLVHLAINLDQETRHQHATAAQDRLTLLRADQSHWIDRPLVPLEWRDVDDELEIRKLVSPLAIPGGPFHASRYAIERLRMAKPSFYPNGTLVEAQVEGEDNIKGIVFYLLLPGEQVALFDGDSNQVHAVNQAKFLENMDQSASVFEYLLFFTHAVWGEHGPFRIVRRLDEIPFLHPLTEEVADRVRQSLVENPLVVKDLDDDWRVETSVQYADALFRATFEIEREGIVRMLTDEPVLTDLPVHVLRMEGPMRIFADEETAS